MDSIGDKTKAPGSDFDANRIVWDPEYRREVIRRLNRRAKANDNTAAGERSADKPGDPTA